MSKHTPGPWTWMKGRIVDGEDSVIVRNERCSLHIGDWNYEQDVADAALIAAAPDLLEAARRCVNDLLLWRGDEPAQTLRLYLTEAAEELRAAISKAEGEQA